MVSHCCVASDPEHIGVTGLEGQWSVVTEYSGAKCVTQGQSSLVTAEEEIKKKRHVTEIKTNPNE